MKKPTGPLLMRATLCLLAALFLTATGAWAGPTTAAQARKVVMNWLAREAAPMGCPLGREIKGVQTFNDDTGAPSYYVVFLNPSGVVFLPADDLVEPIIGFGSATTSYDPSPANPVGALVSRDIPGRVLQARRLEAKNQPLAPDDPRAKARQKWDSLAAGNTGSEYSGVSSLSDVRVAPMVQSTWHQAGADGSIPKVGSPCNYPCYNYNTPPDGYSGYSYNGISGFCDGYGYNYVSGCVATAMAQIMRYWQYPTAPPAGLSVASYKIKIDGTAYTDYFWGGSLAGGAYNWANMPLSPKTLAAAGTLTTDQCKEIGSLCADAGCAVNMSYGMGGSTSYPNYAAYALVQYFNYSNAIAAYAGFSSGTEQNVPSAIRDNMINSSLDGGFPAMFGIYQSPNNNGHAVVCDGYGYNSGTYYNHINFGWSGNANNWYNPPNLDTTDGFDTITYVVYDIYPSGSGEIVSGRVTANGSAPLGGVTVTANGPGGPYTTTTSNGSGNIAAGIYSFRLPSNSTFTISASLNSYSFTPRIVTTGTSVNAYTPPSTPGDAPTRMVSLACGNIWGVNFNSGTPALTLNQALDNNQLTFTSGGDASWFADSTTSYYGGSSARSGTITDSQYSYLQTTVKGPGTLSFYWQVSSEAGYDYLDLWIGSTDTDWISGTGGGWTQKTYSIPAGVHTITWVYSKDPSGYDGYDCGWVDQVVYNRGGSQSALLLLLLN